VSEELRAIAAAMWETVADVVPPHHAFSSAGESAQNNGRNLIQVYDRDWRASRARFLLVVSSHTTDVKVTLCDGRELRFDLREPGSLECLQRVLKDNL